ncbi:MAG: tRNA dihydrouridine synthase DusB [Verrucomicrobiales bacterium]
MLPWFSDGRFPLYLAPMAGVTDSVFRGLCKELGADVMVTEFVSAEGILQADARTRKYTDFDEAQRPVGVQLFGADGPRMGEAARRLIEWKQPDFIDINFGCPVNKVVSKNGGSSLLRDCPLLASVAEGVVKAVEPTGVPVTAKIRIGWDAETINAPAVVRILEESGIQAVAVHGRTRAQGYNGEADWEVIDHCAASATIPVVGNGDIATAADVALRRRTSRVAGLMIGRAAMAHPWIFQEAKHFLATGTLPPAVPWADRWSFMLRHVRLALDSRRHTSERHALQHMRGRLMAYTHGFPGAKRLRLRFSTLSSLPELEAIAEEAMAFG